MSAFRKMVALSLCLLGLVILPSMVEGRQSGASEIELIGEVIKKSELPEPSTAAYPNCLTFLKFRVVKVTKGTFNSSEALVAMWGFRDYKLSEPGGFKVGDKVKLQLVPYKDVENELAGIMRVDDTEDYTSEVYWAPAWELQDKQKEKPEATKPSHKEEEKVVDRIIRVLKAHEGAVIGGPSAKMLFGYYKYLTTSNFWELPQDVKNLRQTSVVPAITAFARYLQDKNIQLVMVFPPSQAAIYPEVAANVDYDFERDGRIDIYFLEFLDALKRENILYVDFLPEFMRNKWTKGPDNNFYPLYIEDDIHWSDIGASLAGKAVGRTIKETRWFQELALQLQPKNVAYKEALTIGKNPPGLYARDKPNWKYPTPNFIRRTLIPDVGSEFITKSNDPASPVWIIGDSFLLTDDFHQDLSATLGLPCYVFSSPGGSPTGPREEFARLKDTSHIKVVIWEITSSYLTLTSLWKRVELNKDKICQLTEKLSQAEHSSREVTLADVTLFEAPRKAFSLRLSKQASAKAADPVSMVWRGIRLGQKPMFSTAIGTKAEATETLCGVEYQILVDNKVVATRKLEQKQREDRYKNSSSWLNKWDVDLSKFAGQTISLELKTVPDSCWSSGEVYWGNAELEDAKL